MADYKELLRKAIEALPENNGTARRGVYEKARSALVGQLRAIQPPLPAKDITQHRLQLEDCIREVEKEASEAVITLKRQEEALARAATTPSQVFSKPVETAPAPLPEPIPAPVAATAPVVAPPVESKPVVAHTSVEDIIAEAESSVEPLEQPEDDTLPESPAVPPPTPMVSKSNRPMPSIVSRIDAASGGTGGAFSSSKVEPLRRAGIGEVRRDNGLAASAVTPFTAPRIEPSLRSQTQAAVALQPEALEGVQIEPDVLPAMSAVREVEVEPIVVDAPTADAQGAIDRAIATLDREARGETTNVDHVEFPDTAKKPSVFGDDEDEAFPGVDDAVAKGGVEPQRGSNAITIFLLVFVVLLAAAGGGAYYAVREGYLDLAGMFGSTPVTAVANADVPAETTTAQIETPATTTPAVADPDPASAPGNTTPSAEATAATAEMTTEDRLEPTPDATTAVAAVDDAATSTATDALDPVAADTLALAPTEPSVDVEKSEERLPTGDEAVAAANAQLPPTGAAVDPAAIAGSQSLLLEASDVGTTGAVPFSGTVDWSRGSDELGQPTLVGKANIPARNLGVDILIRKNADPSLPASHLMEINFDVSQTFIGGSIASLPGVLLKNEELVQGTPLVGASARVVGNSFLFALSASTDDSATNESLLTSRKWIDLAIVYATGKRAILTLEKDQSAETLFTEVFADWDKASDTASTQP